MMAITFLMTAIVGFSYALAFAKTNLSWLVFIVQVFALPLLTFWYLDRLAKKQKLAIDKEQQPLTDEFYQESFSVDLDKLSEFEFCNQINFKDYYIYSADFELLFTVEWDSFFFLIATDSKKMEQLIESKLFEGFLCNGQTDHHWDYMVEK